jgi:hypothetical protein
MHRIHPGTVVVGIFYMQLSNVSFNRDERHDQRPNSNRLARHKFNLVELHG